MNVRARGAPGAADIVAGTARPGTSPGRLSELDSLRGVAAFLVLVQHAHLTVPTTAMPEAKVFTFATWVLFEHTPLRIAQYGRGAVLFFFVLSGYVLTRALLRGGSPGVLAFAAQRTVRLLLPVAASVLLSVALYALVFDPAALPALRARTLFTWWEPPTFADVLSSMTLVGYQADLRLNMPLWSLAHEWRLTVFLPLVLLFRRQPSALLTLCLVLMLAGQVGGARESGVVLGNDLRGLVASTLYFTLAVGTGCVLALAEPLPGLERKQRAAALVGAAVLFSMKSDLAIYAGSALLIIVAQEEGWLRRLLRTTPLVWLGRVSFSLYLVHTPVLVACVYALHRELPAIAVAVIGCAVSLAAAALMHAVVEEPARRLARRVEWRLSRRGPTGRDRRLAGGVPVDPQ